MFLLPGLAAIHPKGNWKFIISASLASKLRTDFPSLSTLLTSPGPMLGLQAHAAMLSFSHECQEFQLDPCVYTPSALTH